MEIDKTAIDKTKFAVVLVGPLTASGESEIHARFIFKKDAVEWLRSQYGTLGRALSQGVEVVRVEGDARMARALAVLRQIESDSATPMHIAADISQLRGEVLDDWS